MISYIQTHRELIDIKSEGAEAAQQKSNSSKPNFP